MTPSFGEASMGALSGLIAGAIGGLVALGVAPALINHNPALLFETPILGLVSFCVSGAFGWLIGGQLGPRVRKKFEFSLAEVIGGLVGGLLPVVGIALLGWYLVTAR